MKKFMSLAIFSVFVLMTMAGCEVSTAKLENVKVCADLNSDKQCESDESSFKSDAERIFVAGDLANAPDGTELTITWTYLGEKESDKPEEIDTVKLTTKDGENTFNSSLDTPTDGWPAGDYEIVLDLGTDNSDPVTKSFTIKEEPQSKLITNLKVCDNPTNDECSRDVKTFGPEVPVLYLSGEIAEVPVGTEIAITWRYLGGEGGGEQDIDTVVLTADETPNVFFSNLAAPDNGWPTGDYQILIELDGKKATTKDFAVE